MRCHLIPESIGSIRDVADNKSPAFAELSQKGKRREQEDISVIKSDDVAAIPNIYIRKEA